MTVPDLPRRTQTEPPGPGTDPAALRRVLVRAAGTPFVFMAVVAAVSLAGTFAALDAAGRIDRSERLASLAATVVVATAVGVGLALVGRRQVAAASGAFDRALAHAQAQAEALRESEGGWRDLVENAHDIIYTLDTEGRLTSVNRAGERFLGYAREELLGTSISRLLAPGQLEHSVSKYRQKLASGGVTTYELEMVRKDGSRATLEINSRLIERGGTVVGVQGIARDVTDRRRGEAALRESEQRLQAVVDSSTAVVYLKDLEGRYLLINRHWAELFDVTREQVIGRTDREIFPPEIADAFRANDLRAAEAGEAIEMEEVAPHAEDGLLHTYLSIKAPLYDSSGTLYATCGISTDITARLNAERERAELAGRIRLLLDSSGEGIYGIDLEGRCTFANRAAEETLGYRPGEVLGRRVHDLVHHSREDGAPYPGDRCPIDRAMREGRGIRVSDDVFWRRDGTPFPVDYSSFPIRVGEAVQGAVVTFRDVTERRQAEEALRQSEERFRGAFDAAAAGMAIVAPDGRWLQVNRSICEIVGYAEDELAGMTFQDITHPDDLEPDLRQVRRMLAGEIRSYQLEKRYIHRRGHEVWVLLSVALVHDRRGAPLYFVVLIEDITPRKRAEEGVRASERMLRAVFEGALDAIVIADDDGRFTDANPAACTLYGRPKGEVVGRLVAELVDPASDFARGWAAFRERGASTGRFRVVRADGAARIVEFAATADVLPGRHLAILRDVTERAEAEEARVRLQRERDRLLEHLQLRWDRMPLAGLICTDDLRIVSWNPAAERIFGFSEEEAVGRSQYDLIIPPAAHAYVREIQRRLDQGDMRADGLNENLTKDGRTITCRWYNTPLMDEGQEVTGYMAMAEDVTEQVRLEEDLRRRNRELAALSAISGAVYSTLRLPGVVGLLRESLAERLDVRGGALFLRSPARRRLALSDAWGLPAPVVASLKALVRAGELVPSAAGGDPSGPGDAGGRPYRIRLEDAPPPWEQGLCLPLARAGASQGVLVLFGPGPLADDDDRTAFFELLGRQVGSAIINARLYGQVRRGRLRLQVLSRRLMAAQEAERRRIARELHDEIGQSLTAVKIAIEEVLAGRGPRPTPDRLEEAAALTVQTIGQVRDISLALRPSVLDDLGLVAALRSLVGGVARRSSLDAQFVAEPMPSRCDPEIETACYRVAQEALTNILRHAGARHVRVELGRSASELHLAVVDDGAGFDVAAATQKARAGGSLGLLGMSERVGLAGGSFAIESRPGRGTEVRASFPLDGKPSRRDESRVPE